jgi:hypothetical protein
MNTDDDPVFEHPESYGIENLDAPGEPDRDELPPSSPVPGTGRKTRLLHQAKHNEDDNSPIGANFKERKQREEAKDVGL